MSWNIAVSDSPNCVEMRHNPKYSNFSGWNEVSSQGDIPVASVALDTLPFVPTVIKLDVEGHEMQALTGMQELLKKYKPKLIVEGNTEKDFIFSLGYTEIKLLGSLRATNYLYT
jgi:FkbM family methyltransferase